jgi:hypothetical protein
MPSRLTPKDRRDLVLRLVTVAAVAVGVGLPLRNPALGLAAAVLVAAVVASRPRARQLWRRATGRPPRRSYYID